jgi:hypothetical protein
MSPIRRLAWTFGVGLANALIMSKGSSSSIGEIVAFLVGAIIGRVLSFAAEKAANAGAARRKMLYWPLALGLFWTFPSVYPRMYASIAVWAFALSTLLGFTIGVAHCVLELHRIRRSAALS